MTLYAEDKSMIFYTYLTAIFAIEKSVPIKALLIKNPKSDYCRIGNVKAQDLLRENREEFVSVAKEWIEKYAK